MRQGEHVVNLYGRSIGAAFAHRFLAGAKGGLYAWEKVRHYPQVIVVEGLFDYAVLRHPAQRLLDRRTPHLRQQQTCCVPPPRPVDLHAESLSQQRKAGISLARRRYQRGTLILRGKREKVWVGRWLEDELQPDETIKRVHKSEVLGSLKDFPTKRLAQRELDGRVSVVNSPTYRARPTATFSELAEKWKLLVMVNHEESSQRSEKSDIKAWATAIGGVQVRNIDCELLQEVVTSWSCSPKTIKNRVGTFRLIWDKAKAWKYTAETAYDGLDLPQWEKEEQPCFSVETIARIIERSPKPYNTVWRLVAETGIRRGEICGLNVGNLDVNRSIIVVQRSRTKNSKLKAPKAGIRNGVVKKRVFSLSPSLTEQLRPFVEGRRADEPLFLTPGRLSKNGNRRGGGVRLEPDNFVKRALKPILKELGLDGLHMLSATGTPRC